MLLTPIEWAVPQVGMHLFRRTVLLLLSVIGLLLAVQWTSERFMQTAATQDQGAYGPVSSTNAAAEGRGSPTLRNPRRLEETTRSFIFPASGQSGGGGGGNSNGNSDRHRTEAACRALLEYMLQMLLPKVRPKWLVNPTTKRRLELDMYNEQHRIAFEYDGAQHDVYTPHYHVNAHHFEYRKLLDRLKAELCREHGVLMIRIPWSEVSVRDTTLTARYLERLLTVHSVPFRSIPAADASIGKFH